MKTIVLTMLIGLSWPSFSMGGTVPDSKNAIASKRLPGGGKAASGPVPCTCAVFLSGQVVRGLSPRPPTGNPAIIHEYEQPFQCNLIGQKQCVNKCLEVLARHLPNSPALICGSMERDCYKERAHLFVKNCDNTWINTNLSAGREFCCKDNLPYKCPLLK